MKKVVLIARREFMAAVVNRGFMVGLLIMPILFAVFAVIGPRLMNSRSAPLAGQVAVIDPTARVLPELRATMSPEGIAHRRMDSAERAMAAAPQIVRDAAASAPATVERLGGSSPELQIVEQPPDADIQAVKAWLTEDAGPARPAAVVVIHRDAVSRAKSATEFGTYDVFVPSNLDDRIETVIYESLREALTNARIRARNLEPREIEAVMRVARPASVTVTGAAERETNRGFNRALPFIFCGLLVFGVMIGGQTLLTQTIEEKSSRVIEVLLAAVSPMELMAGKILGQMAVSLLVLALYLFLGLTLLTSFAMLGLVDPWLVVYLVIFFLITYLLFASVFGAVGAAVNELREAQSLMTPLMILLVSPWLFAPVLAREPNAPFSVALSFIPPVNSFAMMIRLASTTPPPAWQVWISIAIGIAAAYVTIWFAAKIFKIGVLMHGKPPNLKTLLRWARAA